MCVCVWGGDARVGKRSVGVGTPIFISWRVMARGASANEWKQFTNTFSTSQVNIHPS